MKQESAHRSSEGDLAKEKLLLPGWDPSDPVPAIALYPEVAGSLPVVFLFHGINGSKEVLEPWARDLACMGFYVLAIDQHLHGERTVDGIRDRRNLPSLSEEYSVYVHQSAIAHTARDFPVMLGHLQERKELNIEKLGVAGISMGGSLAMVLAWREKRISTVASLIGACDFWWDVTKIPPGSEQETKKKSYGERVRRLVSSIDPWPRLSLIPPKALLITNGRHDRSIDIKSLRRLSREMRKHYKAYPERFHFKEEDVAHHATDTMKRRANEWFGRFLKA
jgi:predicted esterase